MKFVSTFLLLSFLCCGSVNKELAYTGSTPPDLIVRKFLGISLTDSIDFIRWKVNINDDAYSLDCEYGIGKPSTPGFIDRKTAVFSGMLQRMDHRILLQHKNQQLNLVEINENILHLADQNNILLVGNGGFSYVLNNKEPVKSNQFNYSKEKGRLEIQATFQGRTPCREIAELAGKPYDPVCDKLKWYIIFYRDSVTKKPSYFLEGGRMYKKETMVRGIWDILNKNGQELYRLYTNKGPNPIYLKEAGENILFFTDTKGNPFVGNENFSFTLNRTIDREPSTSK